MILASATRVEGIIQIMNLGSLPQLGCLKEYGGRGHDVPVSNGPQKGRFPTNAGSSSEAASIAAGAMSSFLRSGHRGDRTFKND